MSTRSAEMNRIEDSCTAPTGSDRGATAVEYALLVSLIALVIVASVTLFGGNVLRLFDNSASSLPFT